MTNGNNNMKMWEIYRYIYSDFCGDPYYGKHSEHETIGFVEDTEDNVKSLVDKLNVKNHSYYAKDDPDYDYNENIDGPDEDYITYREFKIPTTTIEEIENKYLDKFGGEKYVDEN